MAQVVELEIDQESIRTIDDQANQVSAEIAVQMEILRKRLHPIMWKLWRLLAKFMKERK